MFRNAVGIGMAAALGLSATAARAEWMSGNQLRDACSTSAPVDRAMCLSYVIGVLDGLRYLDQPPKVPEDATAGQVRDVVVKYLADHPETRNQQGRALVRAAIVNAWPDIQPKAAAKAETTTRKKARTKRRTAG